MMRKNNQTILPETKIKLYINYASVLKEKAYKRTNTEVGFPKHKNKKIIINISHMLKNER